MRVRLTNSIGEEARVSFDPDSASVEWRKQSGAARFAISDFETVDDRFGPVFIKHWLKASAPGHDLLVSAIEGPLPGTPRVYDVHTDPSGQYYFLEALPKSYRLLSDLISGFRKEQRAGRPGLQARNLLNKEAISALIKQAAITLGAVWDRGYVYVDLSAKNILVERFRNARFIDVDSCESAATLETARGNRFELTYWTLWREFIAKNDAIDARLPKTMLWSFGAIWARSFALSRRDELLRQAVDLVSDNKEILGSQQILWNALRRGNAAAFADYFMLSSGKTDHFDNWYGLFRRLVEGDDPSWRDVSAAIRGLLVTIEETAAQRDRVTQPAEPVAPPSQRQHSVSAKFPPRPATRQDPVFKVVLTPKEAVRGGRVFLHASGPSTYSVGQANGADSAILLPKCVPAGHQLLTEHGQAVVTSIRDAPGLTLDGDRLLGTADVNEAIARTGGMVRTRAPEGEFDLAVPARSKTGDVLTLEAMGVPVALGRRGDLKIRIRVIGDAPRPVPAKVRRRAWPLDGPVPNAIALSLVVTLVLGSAWFVTGGFTTGDDQARIAAAYAKRMAQGQEGMEAGDFERAIKYFTKAAKLQPSDPAAFQARADAYFDEKKYEQAAADYLTVTNLQGAEGGVYVRLGDAYRLSGALERAVNAYSAAFEKDGRLCIAQVGKARALFEMKDDGGVVVAASAAINCSADAEGFLLRGRAEYDLANYTQALSDFTELVRLTPESESSHQFLSDAYQRLGDAENARQEQEVASALRRKGIRDVPSFFHWLMNLR